ncbi:MAG: hypothetical protein VW378_04985 [bacterium]
MISYFIVKLVKRFAVLFLFVACILPTYAKSSPHRLFFMPNVSLQTISENDRDYYSNNAAFMGMFLSSYYLNYQWSGSCFILSHTERSFRTGVSHYDYILGQAALDFYMLPQLKLSFSTGPFRYKKRSEVDGSSYDLDFESSFFKPAFTYYFSPSNYLKGHYKQSRLDYLNDSPKNTKKEFSLSYYPRQTSSFAPFMGVSHTQTDSYTSLQLLAGSWLYVARNHSLGIDVYYYDYDYSSDASDLTSWSYSLSYTYQMSPSLSLNASSSWSVTPSDSSSDTSKVTLGLSYFSSFDRFFTQGFQQTAALLEHEAQVAMAKKQYKKAEKIVKRLLFFYDATPDRQVHLAFIYHHLGELSRSNRYLMRVLSLDPERLDALYLGAQNHLRLGNYATSITLLSKLYALSKDPKILDLMISIQKKKMR